MPDLDAQSNTSEQVLRRVLDMGNECGATLWLTRTGSEDDWYQWERCNREPGHEGLHSVWADRYDDTWVTWNEDASEVVANYNDLSDVKKRGEPSPWTQEELAYLNRVKT